MAPSTKNSGSVWTIALLPMQDLADRVLRCFSGQAIIIAAAITEAKVKKARISVREENDFENLER